MPAQSPSKPPTAPPVDTKARTVAYDAFVDERVRQTRDAVKATDLATACATLLAGTLGFVLVAALAEHWLAPAGFRPAERYGVFAVGLIGAIAYAGTQIAPIVARRVNPLYAAREIERDSPGLKNGLVNLLQLRDAGGEAPAAVRETLERQAAERLASAPRPAPDRAGLVRALRVALAIAAAIGVYVIASPKDFFASAARVVAPWAEIDAPTRVRIGSVEPGSVEVAQGERVEVAAIVTGLREDERAYLVYSTADGAAADARVAMRPSATGFGYTASLPPAGSPGETLGLQSDVVYRLEAGDARTATARVTVRTAPTMAPVSVRYDYPDYTGYRDRTETGVADLRAIAGTRVTITAEANLPIESAEIDLGADGRPDARMAVDGTTALGAVTLREGVDRYVLRFATDDGRSSSDPPRHAVEVIADLPPEASIVEPSKPAREVRVDESVTFVAEARDPDFALSSVRLRGEATGRPDVRVELLKGDGRGRFVGRTTTTPGRMGLRAGDELAYWFEAVDNRSPQPQIARTERQTLRVVGPSRPQDRKQGERGDRQDGGGQPSGGQDGQSSDQPGGQNSESGQSRGDSTAEDGADGPQQSGEAEQRQREQGDSSQQQGGATPAEGVQRANDSSDGGEAQPDSSGSGGTESQPEAPGGERSASGDAGDRAANSSTSDATENAGDPNGAQQPSGSDQESSGDDPVPADGEDDGEAFNRLREYLENERRSGDPDRGEAAGRERLDADSAADQRERIERAPDGQPSDDVGEPRETRDAPQGESADDTAAQPGGDAADRARDAANAERPDRGRGEGAGERDRRGAENDSTSGESGGDAPPGSANDPNDTPRDGTGSSGENQAADRGSGEAGDRGAGSDSARRGEQREADRPTGEPSDGRPGEGSSSRPGETGDRRGGDGGEPAGDSDRRDGSEGGDRSNEPAGDGATGERGNPSGQPGQQDADADDSFGGSDAGERGESSDGEPAERGDEPTDGDPGGGVGDPQGSPGSGDELGGAGASPGGDAANFDYARKQTELVLERLEEQLRRGRVDRAMLDRLGWTEGDLRRFVERWRGLQREGSRPGGSGRSTLDRRLRGLGLSPAGERRQGVTPDDGLRDLRESTRVGPPPALRDELRDYRRSINAVGDAE